MSTLDQVRDTFFEECEELLEALQEGLMAISDDAADDETIHSVFRAVHSIKGGAGAFGFDDLVRFAHEFETLMDAVRNNVVEADEGIVSTMLTASDVLGDLVIAARDGGTTDAGITDALIAEFQGFLPQEPASDDAGAAAENMAEFAPLTLSLDVGDDLPNTAEARACTIEFHPHGELYRNGNETALLLRALGDLGDLQVSCDLSKLPPLDALDPDQSYLSWKIKLQTSEDEAAIRAVFDFVDGVCDLEIAMADVPELAALPDLSPPEPPTIAEVPQVPASVPELAPELAEASPPPDSPKPVAKKQAKPEAPGPKRGPGATVRVDVSRIDRLINLVGELVMNQAMLAQGATELNIPAASDFATGLDGMKQLAREIQDSVMAIRAQPVKSLFQRMSRIVREAAAATGKKVRLEISGEMTEVDKMVIEKLADPLTHMIRNAVDHGLESTEERIAAGKAEEGTVYLSAAHRSGRIVIDVKDDGGGINRDRVRQIAVEKGIIGADEQLSLEETDALLFRPGFSTVEEVSNLSGRGVGMDVVNNAIRALSGRISIKSYPGEGSTFSISLPLTLAVLDGMVVEVEEQMLVIPISAIIEMLRPVAGNVHALGHDSSVIFARDNYVPVLDVGHILGYRDKIRSSGDRVFVLVETDSGAHSAILVDAIHDQRQVVIKGLEANYGKVPGVAAATVLGDGKTALILDPNDELFTGGGSGAATSMPLGATG